MVVQGDTCTVQQCRGRWSTARLYLELLNPRPFIPHYVTKKERDAEDKVWRDSQHNGEERRSQIVCVVEPQAVPQRLQQRLFSWPTHPNIYTGFYKIHDELKKKKKNTVKVSEEWRCFSQKQQLWQTLFPCVCRLRLFCLCGIKWQPGTINYLYTLCNR